jgi:cobalt/nickel transport protein
MRRVPTRLVLVALFVTALVLAGVVSFYASGSPDGLERVAEDKGFNDTAEDHPAAGGPLADYSTAGVDDSRLSGGIAGVVGSLVVLLLAGGVAYGVRRRPGGSSDSSDSSAEQRTPQTADRP